MKEFFTVGLTSAEQHMLIARYLKVPQEAIESIEWIDGDGEFPVKVSLKRAIESYQTQEACECRR